MKNFTSKTEIIKTKLSRLSEDRLFSSKHYRFLCRILAGVCAAEFVLIIILVKRQTVSIPYVVEINREGDVRYMENASKTLAKWTPSTATVIKALEDYLISLRSVSSDEQVQRKRIEKVYAFSTEKALKTAEDYLMTTKPMERCGNERVEASVYAVTPMINGSSNIYQLDWNEKTYSMNGGLKDEKNFRAVMKTKHYMPKTGSVQETNPLGIYVTELTVSQIKDGYVLYE